MNPVSEAERDRTVGDKLVEIGHLLAEDIRADPEGAYLYAEVGAGWSEVALFSDAGDRFLFRFASDDLSEMLRQLWRLVEPAKRWTSIEYQIVDDRFNASFGYDDLDADDNETSIDRRTAKVFARFGEKPIDYSDAGRDQDFIDQD